MLTGDGQHGILNLGMWSEKALIEDIKTRGQTGSSIFQLRAEKGKDFLRNRTIYQTSQIRLHDVPLWLLDLVSLQRLRLFDTA